MRYQNVSAATWQRPSGEAVPPGAVFDATDREHVRIQRRGYQLARLRLVDGPAASDDKAGPLPPLPVVAQEVQEAAGEQVGPAASSAPPTLAEWTLRMTPEVYLKLHPTGPHAALAQTLVEA